MGHALKRSGKAASLSSSIIIDFLWFLFFPSIRVVIAKRVCVGEGAGDVEEGGFDPVRAETAFGGAGIGSKEGNFSDDLDKVLF